VNVDTNAVAGAVWNYSGTINNNIITQLTNGITCSLDKLLNLQEGWGVNIPQC
jgi:hypothetical protein